MVRPFTIVALLAISLSVANASQRPPTLFEAARLGDLEAVKLYLQRGDDPNGRYEWGQRPLHVARNAAVARALLAAGATADIAGDRGQTPLEYASDLEVAKLLVQNGASLNRGDMSPLSYQIGLNHLDIVEYLIKRGANLNPIGEAPPLFVAAESGNIQAVRMLCDHGAKVNARGPDGQTALHRAKSPQIANLLLAHGAWVDAKTTKVGPNRFFAAGSTPLHFAAIRGYAGVVETLVRHGANVNAKNALGKTALQCAVERHHGELALYLRPKGGR